MHKRSHQEWLAIINDSKYKSFDCDTYNEGPLVDLIETKVSALLDKPNALFFNKGTVCQLAALKTICEQKNNPVIAIHSQSHIAFDEDKAYQNVTQLEALKIGTHNNPIRAKDLQELSTIPSVLVIEMPLRRAGFKLADWAELEAIRIWCHQHKVHLHMDGARLWESAPFYQKDVTTIGKLFDSIYISLYKGIGGLSGALLAGEHDLISATAVWRNRLGSQMWSNFPALITGLEGIDTQLPLIPEWVIRAKQIANLLSPTNGLNVQQPQTNGFLIKFKGHQHTMNKHMQTLVQEYNMSPCIPWKQLENEQIFTEVQVGRNHHRIDDSELVDFFSTLSHLNS